jgi:hypothetical protein
MVLTQRRLRHATFGLMVVVPLLVAIIIAVTIGLPQSDLMIRFVIGSLVPLGLWLAYARGWEPARHVLVLFLTFIIGFSLSEGSPWPQQLVLPVLFPAGRLAVEIPLV